MQTRSAPLVAFCGRCHKKLLSSALSSVLHNLGLFVTLSACVLFWCKPKGGCSRPAWQALCGSQEQL